MQFPRYYGVDFFGLGFDRHGPAMIKSFQEESIFTVLQIILNNIYDAFLKEKSLDV